MSRTKRTSKQKTRDPRPGYARVLRLRHIRPGRIACFVFFEGSIALAFLLGFAELISVWTALAIPVLVAVMVKMNDIIAGAVAGPADDATEDPLVRQWETDLAEDDRDQDEYGEDEYGEDEHNELEPERDDDAELPEPAVAGAQRSATGEHEDEASPDEYDDDVDSDVLPGVHEEPETGGPGGPDEPDEPEEGEPEEGGPDEGGPDEGADESEEEPDDDVDTDARHKGAPGEPGEADTEVAEDPSDREDAAPALGGGSDEAVSGATGENDVERDQSSTVESPEEPVASAAPSEDPEGADRSEEDPEAWPSEAESDLREHADKRR